MKVSFIIVTKDRFSMLVETLTNLNKLTNVDYEIIVVDNGSTDETPTIKNNYNNLKYIQLDYNSGEWEGRNIAIRHANGDLICSLDDDSFPGENSIQRAVKLFRTDSKLGILSMDVLDYDTHYNSRREINDDVKDVLAFIGCGAIFRRKLLEEVGMWENWFSGAIEHSFSIRVMNAGYKIQRHNNIYVYHHMTQKSRKMDERIHYHAINIYKAYETYWGFWGAIPLCFRMLRRGVLNDLLSRHNVFTNGFLQFCKLGRSKHYHIDNSVLSKVRIPLWIEGNKFTCSSMKPKKVKSILLLRTRPVQLLPKYMESTRKLYPTAKVDLLTHNTNLQIPNIFNRIITYTGKDNFQYDDSMKNMRYDQILFCAEEFKVIGGYENIQTIAKKMKTPLASISISGTLIEYTKKDLLFINICKIFSNLISVVIFGLYFLRFRKRNNYYFEKYQQVSN